MADSKNDFSRWVQNGNGIKVIKPAKKVTSAPKKSVKKGK